MLPRIWTNEYTLDDGSGLAGDRICSDSTAFATLPSSSTPLRRDRSPARLIDRRDISVMSNLRSLGRRSADALSGGGDGGCVAGVDPAFGGAKSLISTESCMAASSSTCGGWLSTTKDRCPTNPCIRGRTRRSADAAMKGWMVLWFQKYSGSTCLWSGGSGNVTLCWLTRLRVTS